jgi:hypothetical protein
MGSSHYERLRSLRSALRYLAQIRLLKLRFLAEGLEQALDRTELQFKILVTIRQITTVSFRLDNKLLDGFRHREDLEAASIDTSRRLLVGTSTADLP